MLVLTRDHCRRRAVLTWWWRERWSTFLRPLDLPTAFFFMCGRPAWWVTPRGRASCAEGDVLTGRWQRRSMGYIARSRRQTRQQEGRCRRAPIRAD